MDIQINHEHYYDDEYNTKERFCSFWHQINESLALKPKNILEIGKGNGFVSGFLEKAKIEVSTLDIDPALNPTILGSVLDIPAPDASFDLVSCCEVLEHLPYSDFTTALKEIHRVTRSYSIISLPDLERVYRFNLQLPKKIEWKFLYHVPRMKPLKWEFNGEHYWNIGVESYPLRRIVNDLNKAGLTILKNYRVFEIPWHRFFVLKKAN